MALHPLAGKPAPRELLQNLPRLVTAYFTHEPDPNNQAHQVAFGTSGHRGSSVKCSFNEQHILAITQAICDYRRDAGIDGPLFIGMDTHALSEPAQVTAIEVLAANEVEVVMQAGLGYAPTPAISHAILTYNRGRHSHLADGVVITPSHNPPDDGGFKYNPPSGGPADTSVTKVIEDRANALLRGKLQEVKRLAWGQAKTAATTHEYDFVTPYVGDLKNILDMETIAGSGLKIGVDPMGGASAAYWQPIAEMYGLNLTVVNPAVDATFGFMTVDKDGKIRMDCSSPYAMASLIALKDRFDVAFGNDPDADRHGIVTRSVGLMNPNHYLAVAIWYLFQHRPGWRADAARGWGDAAVAAMSIVSRIFMFLMSVALGIGQGFQPVAAFNYGAGLYKRVRGAALFTMAASFVLVSGMVGLCWAFAPELIRAFRDDPAVYAIALPAFRFQALCMFLQPVMTVSNMLFQSIGKVGRATFLACCRQGIFFIPLILILPASIGILGVEICQPIADLLTFLVSAPLLIAFLRELGGKKTPRAGAAE